MAKETRKYWQMRRDQGRLRGRLRKYWFETEVVPFGGAPTHRFHVVIEVASDESAALAAGKIGQKLNLMLTLVE